MIHDLEIILHLVRANVQSIDAVGVPVLSRREDIANARIRFENGCVANMTSSRISPERMRKIRVFQEDAYLSLDYQSQSGEIYRRTRTESSAPQSRSNSEEPLKRQLLSFIECARTGLRPKVSGFEATAALEFAVEITKKSSDGTTAAKSFSLGPNDDELYFLAGETSGDNHGAALIGALRKLQPGSGYFWPGWSAHEGARRRIISRLE